MSAAINLPSDPLLTAWIEMEYGWKIQVDYVELPLPWPSRHDLPDVELIGVRLWIMGEHTVELPLERIGSEAHEEFLDAARDHQESQEFEIDDFRESGAL